MGKLCHVCGIFQKEGWTIENLADEENSEKFPSEYKSLITYKVINAGTFEGYYAESILQCPKCGLLYNYECHLPGGSYDAMRTWVVEKLYPVIKNGKHSQKNVPPKPKKIESLHEFKCPSCGSFDIETPDAGNIGGEVFISLKCMQCGNEDTLDEYQLIAWRV